jgi:hypothetical protein
MHFALLLELSCFRLREMLLTIRNAKRRVHSLNTDIGITKLRRTRSIQLTRHVVINLISPLVECLAQGILLAYFTLPEFTLHIDVIAVAFKNNDMVVLSTCPQD